MWTPLCKARTRPFWAGAPRRLRSAWPWCAAAHRPCASRPTRWAAGSRGSWAAPPRAHAARWCAAPSCWTPTPKKPCNCKASGRTACARASRCWWCANRWAWWRPLRPSTTPSRCSPSNWARPCWLAAPWWPNRQKTRPSPHCCWPSCLWPTACRPVCSRWSRAPEPRWAWPWSPIRWCAKWPSPAARRLAKPSQRPQRAR